MLQHGCADVPSFQAKGDLQSTLARSEEITHPSYDHVVCTCCHPWSCKQSAWDARMTIHDDESVDTCVLDAYVRDQGSNAIKAAQRVATHPRG